MLDSNFYPGFFDTRAKLDVARGPLAFIIKNYIARCNGVPKLIAYKNILDGAHYAYFANEVGLSMGMVQCESQGSDMKYTLWNANVAIGGIDSNNMAHYAASTKPTYIVSAITKERVTNSSPAKNASRLGYWFPNMISTILYKHSRKVRKEPEPPPQMTFDEMRHITPVLLDGVSPLAMPANVRQKVERVHAYANNRSDAQLEWETHVKEMFGREKWVVMPRKFVDASRVYTVGAIEFTPEVLDTWIKDTSVYSAVANGAKITQPFVTYRTIEELPDELQGLMTMQQHMLKTTHGNYVTGTNNVVPYTGSTDSIVWPEMNSGVYDIASDTVAYILDK
jgi:hypothetical protein